MSRLGFRLRVSSHREKNQRLRSMRVLFSASLLEASACGLVAPFINGPNAPLGWASYDSGALSECTYCTCLGPVLGDDYDVVHHEEDERKEPVHE
jgi:hypothetical protein